MFLQRVWSLIRHNQALFFSALICSFSLLVVYGCESRVQSLSSPGVLVSRDTLEGELDSLLSLAESRFRDLDRHDEFKRRLFGEALAFVEAGKLNPLSVLITLGNILGFGAVIDNRRKDVKIKTLKSENDDHKSRIASLTNRLSVNSIGP